MIEKSTKDYTDKFFKVPVRIYNRKEIDKNDLLGLDIDTKYVVGWEAILPKDIKRWYDSYEEGRSDDDIQLNGFDSIILVLEDDSYIECNWTSGKFEDELNKFMKNHNQSLPGRRTI